MPLSDIARAVEDQFHRDSIPVLKRQGWRPRVIPYDGYGTSAPAESAPSSLADPSSERRRWQAPARPRIDGRPDTAPATRAARPKITTPITKARDLAQSLINN